MQWNSTSDIFSVKVKNKFSKKVKGIRKDANIHVSALSEKVPIKLTKGEILSQINAFFDPMGLRTEFAVKTKVL